MRSQNGVATQIELRQIVFNEAAVSEALRIEEVLNRAHRIHRAHGGLFGYDLEDWLQAERELAEKDRMINRTSNEEAAPGLNSNRDGLRCI